jgi:hypothetical protein
MIKANQKYAENNFVSEPTELYNKTKQFFSSYNIQDKYNISLDNFNEITLNRANEAILKKIKIGKKVLKKLLDDFDKFMNDQVLFIR